MNGLGQWTRDAARGDPDLRCQGCRKRPAVVQLLHDGVPLRLCGRCARVRAARPDGAGVPLVGEWVEVVRAPRRG